MEVGGFLARWRVEVMGVTKHFLTGEEVPVVPGYRWVEDVAARPDRGDRRKPVGGVALLVREESAQSVQLIRSLCTDHMAWAAIRRGKVEVQVGVVYAPVTGTAPKMLEEFCVTLRAAVAALHQKGPVVILGDFNTDMRGSTPRAEKIRQVLKGVVILPSPTLAAGTYTFCRGRKRSHIDFVISSMAAREYKALMDVDLNTDGHIPV